MYSDPHTNSSRKLWIVGTTNGIQKAIRLSPLDERLINKKCGGDEFYDDTWELDDVAWDYRDFPSGKDLTPLRKYYDWYLGEYKNEELVKTFFPQKDLRLVVMQQAIAPDFDHIESIELTNLPF